MASAQRTVTKSLTVRYLRAVPLDEEVELWGGCAPDGDQFKAKFEVRARGEIAVAGTGVLVPYKNLAKRAGITRHGRNRRPGPKRRSEGLGRLRLGRVEPGGVVDADEHVLVHAVPDLAGVGLEPAERLVEDGVSAALGVDRSCTRPSTLSSPWYTPWPQPSRT